jgi:hypothetical protein
MEVSKPEILTYKAVGLRDGLILCVCLCYKILKNMIKPLQIHN